MMSRCLLVGTVFVLFLVLIATGQKPSDNDEKNRCSSMTSCSECISAGPQCAWCSGTITNQPNSLDRRRCDVEADLKQRCSDVYNPQYSPEIKKDLNFGKTSDQGIIQLRPQSVYLPIKPNSPQQIRVQFQQALDYPVDLYYLMDLSRTMTDDKKNLEILAEKIGLEMSKITSNYRLGFGSFVDKLVLPFTEEVPSKLKNPCFSPWMGHIECASPYGFKHHMKLNNNAALFTDQVKSISNSANRDDPEGVLDAIMQAMVCSDEIGWRDQARRIILVATDGEYHLAGDGKLGGIVIPNDGGCHLNENGEYTKSSTTDYPSIAHINYKAKQQKINILFAVTSGVFDVYKELSRAIEGSYIGQLSHDSSNVVDLIREQYKKISSSVTLKDDATGDVRLTYVPKCPSAAASSGGKNDNTCHGLKVGTTVSFDVLIDVSSCPRNANDRRQAVQIYPVGINESLIIDLDIQCECECGRQEAKSSLCSDLGTLDCGICSCPDHRVGLACECDSNRLKVSSTDVAPCKAPNSSNVCSGRGKCSCGLCTCTKKSDPDELIYGTFCEFDNFNCKKAYGQVCGGPERGECHGGDNSYCECNKGFTGETCSCPDHDDDCATPDGKICSGKGVCNCGLCDCNVKNRFVGSLCQDWDPQMQCKQETRNCVLCSVFPESAFEEKLPCATCNIDVEKNDTSEERNEQKCELYKDEKSCLYFYYKENVGPANDGRIRFKNDKECSQPVSALLIGGGIIGTILAIGIGLLFLWKILTTLHDRKEFAKFESDRKAAKWDKGINPLYHRPVATFSNPTFSGNGDEDGVEIS